MTPKFLHIPAAAKYDYRFNSSVSLRGRLVGRMSMESAEKATCPKCLAVRPLRGIPAGLGRIRVTA